MGEVVDQAAVVARLVGSRHPARRRGPVCGRLLEYREASENIAAHGVIVQHPRTANPIENPYVVVRDRALKKLQAMRHVNATDLW